LKHEHKLGDLKSLPSYMATYPDHFHDKVSLVHLYIHLPYEDQTTLSGFVITHIWRSKHVKYWWL